MDARDDAAALNQLHTDFVEAFRSNDAEAMNVFFSDAAVLLPPRRALVSGKANAVAFWQNAQRIQDLAFEATDVELLGETVLREAGNLQMTMRGEGRETRTMDAKYMAVWVKTGDSWKLDSLVWNGAAGQQQAAGERGAQAGGYGQQRGGGGGPYGQRQGGRGRQGGGRRGGGGAGGGAGGGGGRGQAGGYGQGGGGGGRRGRGGGQGGGGFGQGGGYAQGGGDDAQGGAGGGKGGGYGGRGGGGAQGGGYGQGGGAQGGDGYGQRPAGGGRGRPGGGGQGGGGGGGGFGRRMPQQRAHEEAPMVPRID